MSFLFPLWRKVRDSNPRYPKGVYRISSPAHSVTLPTFLIGCKVINYFCICKIYSKESFRSLDFNSSALLFLMLSTMVHVLS